MRTTVPAMRAMGKDQSIGISAADQEIGAAAGHDGSLGVDAVIAAGEVARLMMARGGKHSPDELALMRLAEIDAELGDHAGVLLGRSVMIRAEGAGDAFVRRDDIADTAVDRAIERAEPERAGADWGNEDRGGKRGSGTGKCFDHWKGPFAKILAPD